MSFVQKNVARAGAVLKDPALILKIGPAEKASRRMFGNTAGLLQNIVGKTAVYARRVYPNVISFDHSDAVHVRQMHEQGFAKVSGMYDGQDFGSLKSKVIKALDAHEKTAENPYNTFIRNPHVEIPELFELANERIVNYARDYFRSHVVVSDIMPYRTKFVPKKVIESTKGDIYSNRWHCDTCRTSILTFFVLLTDVAEDDGPFHFISKPDTRIVTNNGAYNHRDDSEKLEQYLRDKEPQMIRKFTGKAGDVVFFNTSESLHRAELIRKRGGKRDMVRIDLRPTFGKHPERELYIVKG